MRDKRQQSVSEIWLFSFGDDEKMGPESNDKVVEKANVAAGPEVTIMLSGVEPEETESRRDRGCCEQGAGSTGISCAAGLSEAGWP